ncbi:MAG: DNA (cytosine-5-)-methyltransferase [Acetobacteraceae bacterium]|nr:DNA (cytosine-5-)-methyltransferase [Acetobacteraceae bacterium]
MLRIILRRRHGKGVRYLNVVDLFSGIGGFSLGFERAGLRTVAFCESDRFARRVLRRHWPHLPCYGDIRTLSTARLRADGIAKPDLLCGGFPCQDVSAAGRGAGLAGIRSGLWREMLRLIDECRPRWVVAENVPTLRSRGADTILAALEAIGYACWPLVVGAEHAGAPHRRRRVWIVAYAESARLEEPLRRPAPQTPRLLVERRRWWASEPGMDRVAHGLPSRVDRVRCLGNAIVPEVATYIGRAIMHIEARGPSAPCCWRV